MKYDSCVLTDPPTHICVKHNGDEKPEDEYTTVSQPDMNELPATKFPVMSANDL